MVHAIFYSGFICTVTSKVFHFHDEFEVVWIGAGSICSVQCYIFFVFVLSAIIVWIILSLVFHWTVLLFNGASDFKNFLFFSGYGFGAMGITYLVVLFVYMTGIPKGLAIEQMQQDVSFKNSLVLINIGFMIYYAWIVYAMYFLHKLGIVKSIASVACPMLLYFILTQLFSYI